MLAHHGASRDKWKILQEKICKIRVSKRIVCNKMIKEEIVIISRCRGCGAGDAPHEMDGFFPM